MFFKGFLYLPSVAVVTVLVLVLKRTTTSEIVMKKNKEMKPSELCGNWVPWPPTYLGQQDRRTDLV